MYNTDTHTVCTVCLSLSLTHTHTYTHTQIKCWGSICSQSRGRKLYFHWWIRTDQGRRKCEGHFSWKEKQEQRLSGLCNYKLFPVARTKNWAANTFTFMGFLAAQLVKNLPAMQKNSVQFLGWEVSLEREWVPIPVFLGFPGASHSEESTCNAGDLDSIPGLGRSLGGGHGNPLQYFCLENPHGQRCLVGYSPWGCKESAERLSTAQHSMLLMIPPFFLSTFILGSAKSRHSIKNIYK